MAEFTISNRPLGFNSFFGLNDMGAVPREVSDAVAPVIDMTEFFAVNKETLSVAVNATGVGPISVFAVPQGQLWRIDGISVEGAALGAGQRIAAALRCAFPAPLVLSEVGRASQTGELLSVHCDCPYWIPAGSVIDVNVTDYAGGGLVTLTAVVRITRLRM